VVFHHTTDTNEKKCQKKILTLPYPLGWNVLQTKNSSGNRMKVIQISLDLMCHSNPIVFVEKEYNSFTLDDHRQT